jgi:hypothetical protein
MPETYKGRKKHGVEAYTAPVTVPDEVGRDLVPVCTAVADPRYALAPLIFEQNNVANYVKHRVMETLNSIAIKMGECALVDSKLLETQLKYLQFAKELADKGTNDPMQNYTQMRSMMLKEAGKTKKMTLTMEETVNG